MTVTLIVAANTIKTQGKVWVVLHRDTSKHKFGKDWDGSLYKTVFQDWNEGSEGSGRPASHACSPLGKKRKQMT